MGEPVVLRRAGAELRPVVERLWQLYRHDLSEFRGMLPRADGTFQQRRLDALVDDPDAAVYLFFSGQSPAGFALVSGVLKEPRTIVEFFVVRAARGQGIGHDAAVELLSLHPGRWQIAFQEENPTAARFWRRIASIVAGEAWQEERRPVPGKPELPPDVWITLDARDAVREGH